MEIERVLTSVFVAVCTLVERVVLCVRGVTRKTERNLLYIFGNDSRPVTAPRSRCGLGISRAPKRIKRARRETSVDPARIFTRRYQRANEATLIVNVSPRDGVQRHT